MKLFHRVMGSGPPIVILHGLYGSSDNWMSIARILMGRFTVVLPDLRNHGKSPHSDEMSYDSMADDIRDLLIETGFKKVFMVGHSMGGKVATSFALKYPGQIMGLIVADISPFTAEREENNITSFHAKIISCLQRFEEIKATSRRDIEKYFTDCTGNPDTGLFLAKNVAREGSSFILRINIGSISTNFKSIFAPVISVGDSSPISVSGFPVIFLRGVLSPYLQPSSMTEIKKIFPAAEMISIDGAGHWLHAEKPAEVCKAIFSLLE